MFQNNSELILIFILKFVHCWREVQRNW